VKILDFGLAKVNVQSAIGSGNAQATAGSELNLTSPGTTMGTVAYMSPEQARGEPLDSRTDLFSFGVVLYEMATGRQPFAGSTSAVIFNQILEHQPAKPATVNPRMPARLEEIIEKMLQKDRDLRCQTAAELRGDLKRLKRDSESGRVAVIADKPSPSQRGSISKKSPWALVGVAVLALAAGFFLGRSTVRLVPLMPPVYRQLTFRHGAIRMARFASDGKTMLYSGAWEENPIEIYTTRPESPESRPFGLEGAAVEAVSQGEMAVLLHSRSIEPYINSGTLSRVPLGGGAPREVQEGVQWADWAPDGNNFVVVRDLEGQNRLEFPISKVLYKTAGWISHPRFSPDGKWISFLEHPQRRDDMGFVSLIDVNGNEKKISQEWESLQGLAWSPRGDEV
jgi:hypothetical protein